MYNTQFSGPSRIYTIKGISIVSDVFAGFMVAANRQYTRAYSNNFLIIHIPMVCAGARAYNGGLGARGFPRHSLDEDDVRLPRMAWHVLSGRSRKT